MSDFVATRGLHPFAHRCRDAEQTRRFGAYLLGLPRVHVVRADHAPSAGEDGPQVDPRFEMTGGSSE